MLRLWGATQGITAYYIGQNLFVFQFNEDFERKRVLNGACLTIACYCGKVLKDLNLVLKYNLHDVVFGCSFMVFLFLT